MAGILGNLLAGQASDVGQKACTLPGIIGFDYAARLRNRIVGEIQFHQRIDVFFRQLLSPDARNLRHALDDPGNGAAERIVLRNDNDVRQ